MRAVMLALAFGLLACAARAESGVASVYNYGRLTADGERFNPHAMTAAHRKLPFGTVVEVCIAERRARRSHKRSRARERANAGARRRRCIIVRINDRGPFVRGRIIDLTPAAARALGFSGLARVTVEPLAGYRPRRGDFGFF
jgi:rare lipoprotein A